MRNLKKILAMVLALVMSLSLMATAGASSFKDVDDSNPYATAIDVLDALKVFIGYEDGSFQPTGELTRAEAAVLVYRIATGDTEGKYVENYTYMANSKFNDLDNGYSWAKGYINYCQNAEIIKGTSATTFSPGLKVTGYQLMVMVLRTLGYDKAGEFSDPITWELESARKCEQLRMLDNIPNTGDFGNPASRQMTAEILFQGLLQDTVNYSVMTPGGYTSTGKTLGFEKFTLEEVTGVVVANEYAGILREKDATTGVDKTAAGRTVLWTKDGKAYEMDIASGLEDLGETRVAYTTKDSGRDDYNLKCVALIDPKTDNVTYEDGEKLDKAAFAAKIKGTENERYINFGETPGIATTSIKVTYQAQQITERVSALDNAAAIKKFCSTYHLVCDQTATPKQPANITATATYAGSGAYDVTYTPSATDKIVGASAANPQIASDGKGHVFSITWYTPIGDTARTVYRVEVEPKAEYTSFDRRMVKAIFDKASWTLGGGVVGLVVKGEVFRGTQVRDDYSDRNDINVFYANCINEAPEHKNEDINTNERGWWLKIIDNDNDGITDWVFQTRYTVAKVSAVNADTGVLTLDTPDTNIISTAIVADKLQKDEVIAWGDTSTHHTGAYDDSVNNKGANISASNESGETLESGDVVYYASIDGANYAWKSEVVSGRVSSINRQALTVTVDGVETPYNESAVHEHSQSTDIASGVVNMSGTTNMNLYMDNYGNVAAFSQNIVGNFTLLTNGWYNNQKNGVEYAVTAWDSTDKALKQYDITQGGSLFIGPNSNTQNNSWNNIQRFVPLNCDSYTAHTDDIHTIVAYMETDGENAKLIPVDTIYDVERLNDRRIAMIDMGKTIPGSALSIDNSYANGNAPQVKIRQTATLAGQPYSSNGGATRVRALSNTTYLFVYQSYLNQNPWWVDNHSATAANGLYVEQREGYVAGTNFLSASDMKYVEDVYVVGTKAVDVNGDYYTANVVVVELSDDFNANHTASEEVFIYNLPTTVTWSTIENVDVIRATGEKETLKVDLTLSRNYTEAGVDAEVSGIGGAANAEPGLFYLHRTSRTDSEGIWAIERMSHEEIRRSNRYDVGDIVTSFDTIAFNYAQVRDYYCRPTPVDVGGNGTYHTNIQPVPNTNYYHNPSRKNVDGTSKYYVLSYNGEKWPCYATMTTSDAKNVLRQWYAGSVTSDLNHNQVLVRYDNSGNVVYAISFAHGTATEENYAQKVWRSVVLDVAKTTADPTGVTYYGIGDKADGTDVSTAGVDQEGDARVIEVQFNDAWKWHQDHPTATSALQVAEGTTVTGNVPAVPVANAVYTVVITDNKGKAEAWTLKIGVAGTTGKLKCTGNTDTGAYATITQTATEGLAGGTIVITKGKTFIKDFIKDFYTPDGRSLDWSFYDPTGKLITENGTPGYNQEVENAAYIVAIVTAGNGDEMIYTCGTAPTVTVATPGSTTTIHKSSNDDPVTGTADVETRVYFKATDATATKGHWVVTVDGVDTVVPAVTPATSPLTSVPYVVEKAFSVKFVNENAVTVTAKPDTSADAVAAGLSVTSSESVNTSDGVATFTIQMKVGYAPVLNTTSGKVLSVTSSASGSIVTYTVKLADVKADADLTVSVKDAMKELKADTPRYNGIYGAAGMTLNPVVEENGVKKVSFNVNATALDAYIGVGANADNVATMTYGGDRLFYGIGFEVPVGTSTIKVAWGDNDFNAPESPQIVNGYFYEYFTVAQKNGSTMQALRPADTKTWNYDIQFFDSTGTQIGATQNWEITRNISAPAAAN